MTRILIVEDEVSFSDPLSYLLSKEGYEVSVAENGHDALTAFDATGADLVLLDLMLPGLSGVDVVPRPAPALQRAGHHADRQGQRDRQGGGLELGADDYVTKPYSSRELLARIKAVLRRLPEPEEMLPTDPRGRPGADGRGAARRHRARRAGVLPAARSSSRSRCCCATPAGC